MSSANLELFLEGLNAVFGSSVFAALLVIAFGLLLFSIYLLLSVGTVYLVFYAWSGYEDDYDGGNEKQSGFDEEEVWYGLLLALSRLADAVGTVLSLGLSAVVSVATTILSNPIEFILLVLVFIGTFWWGAYHQLIIRELAEASNCFFAPVYRTLVLPVLNIIALALGAWYPIQNFVRHVVVSVTTETIIDSLACAGEQTLVTLRLASLTLISLSEEISEWIRLGQTGRSVLDIGPDLFNTSVLVGRTLASLDVFAFCACEPLAEVVVRPLFEPLRSTQFATAVNATLTLVPVFITQGVLRPIIRSVQNVRSAPGAPLNQTIVRPSFNSTFDTADAALNNTGQVGDLFVRAGFEVILNVIGAAAQSCEQIGGWRNTRRCTASPDLLPLLNGTCMAGQCITPFVVSDVGCCVVPGAPLLCERGATNSSCVGFFGAPAFLARGEPCAGFGTLTCSLFGCCGRDLSFAPNGTAQFATCTEDAVAGECTAPSDRFVLGQRCTAQTVARCAAISTASTSRSPSAVPRSCGTCSGAGFCQCNRCLCGYERSDERFVDAPPVAAGNCTRASEIEEEQDVCIAQLPPIALPPVPGLFTGALGLLYERRFIAQPRFVFNIVFNVDLVFGRIDGIRFWNITDTIGATINQSAENLAAFFFTWPADLIVSVGEAVIAATSPPAVEAELIRLGTRFVARLIRIARDALLATVRALVATLAFLIDQFVGIFYGAVESAITRRGLDPFFHAKRTFGGDEPAGVVLVCVLPSTNANGTAPALLFTASVNNLTASTCTSRFDVLDYCRYVFRQSLVETSDTAALAPTPSYLTVTPRPGIVAAVRSCVASVPGCTPVVAENVFGQLAPNLFDVLLEQYVEIFRILDQLWLEFGLVAFRNVLNELAQSIKTVLLAIIDFIVHLREVFTTFYAACLDVEGVLDAINRFVRALTDVVRRSSPPITGITCQAGVGARSGAILCAIPQAVDSFVQIFTELVRIVWLLFVNILRVFEGTRTVESVANVFNTLVLEAHVRDFVFAVFAIVTSFIPQNVTCATGLDATHGCCSARLTINGIELPSGVCVERQASAESCTEFIDAHLTTNSRANIDNINPRLFPGLACAAVPDALCVDSFFVSDGLTLDTRRGCCADLSREMALPFGQPPAAQALHCVENQLAFACVGPNEQFTAGTLCSNVPGPAGPLCPLTTPGSPAQPILAEALEQVVVDLLLFIPRIIIGVIQGLVDAITEGALDDSTFVPLATAFLRPIVVLFIDSFLSLARLFGCIGAFVIQDTLDVLADVLDVVLAVAIEILADLILAVVEFLGGILQVFVEFRFTLLARSALTLLRVFASLVFAIFGPDVGCALQDALCALVVALDVVRILFNVPIVPLTDVDLFVGQCRLRDCCETFPVIEPFPDGSVSLCAERVRFPRPFVFNNCSGAIAAGFCNDTQGTAPTFRKRSDASHENTFVVRLNAELRALIDKYNGTAAVVPHQNKVPNELFCGSYIATYGYAEAKRQRRRADGPENQEAQLAVECLEVMEQTGYGGSDAKSIKSAQRAWVLGALLEEARPFARIAYMLLEEIGEHFHSVHNKARQAADAYIAGDKKRAAALLAPTRATGFAAVLKRQHGLDLKQFRRGKITKKQNLAKRSVFKAESTFIVHHTLVEVAHTAILSHHSIFERGEIALIKNWLAERASTLRVPDINFGAMAHGAATASANAVEKQYAGIEMFLKRVGALAARRGERWAAQVKQQILKYSRPPTLREWAAQKVRAVQKAVKIAQNIKSSRLFPPYRHQFVTSRRQLGFAVQQENGQVDEILGNDTLETLSLFVCNASAQICTDCVVVDNLIGAVTTNGRALLEFYPNTTDGFLSYVARFEENLDTTLINPLGTDTYTTQPKRVPWVFTRFTRVRWFWQWDYSEFLAILASGSTPDPMPERFVNRTGVIQRQFAAELGRVDLENNVYTLLEPAILPALNALERIVGSFTDTIERSVLLRIYERYIQCDYNGALLCRGDRGIDSDQPLFDALANVLLVYALAALLFGALLPLGDNVFSTIIMLVPVLYLTYIIVLWIAYGASFLCTLNALFSGIPGVPSCFPLDVYNLFNELIPQCGVIPIPLIDPAALPEASTTLCSVCGTTPPLRNCAPVAGFLNGLDNLFYTLTSLFGEQAGQVLGDTFGSVLPIIAATADLYTAEYVAMLGAAGEVCNQITFVNLGTLALILIFITATALATIAFGALFAFLVIGLYLVVLYVINVMFRQIDEGFVQGTRVRKLKQE